MPELITNLHMHTIYSDGSGTHQQIADVALAAGLDVVITTDHNILVQGVEGYFQKDNRRVLLLVGEEIHDPIRVPQKNHLIVIGAARELATQSGKPQNLLDQVFKAGGLSFIAHPFDPELRAFGEDDISWVDWDTRGFTGLELWNGFSELKSVVHSKLEGIFYAYFPQYMARGPLPAALKKWDEFLARDQKVVAIGGSDAHALKMRMGPLRRTIFPYAYHFRAINTHLLVENEMSGNLSNDRQMIIDAFRKGHAFIGYDLPAPTRGFRFTAQGKENTVSMGDEIRLGSGVTLQIRLPMKTECHLVRNGEIVQTWKDREICAHIAGQPGAYRVECFVEYLGRQRGWIFSNPIYVRG